jgi:hypothetical protein
MRESRFEVSSPYEDTNGGSRFVKRVLSAVSGWFIQRPVWQPLAIDEEEVSGPALSEPSGAEEIK